MTHPSTTTPRADRRGMQIPGAGPVARLLLAGWLSLVVVIVDGLFPQNDQIGVFCLDNSLQNLSHCKWLERYFSQHMDATVSAHRESCS